VLAAATLGRRLVALVFDGSHVAPVVRGKQLRPLGRMRNDAADLPPSALEPAPLVPLYYFDSSLLCRLGGTWWRFSADMPPAPQRHVVAVGPGKELDHPTVVMLHGDRLSAGGFGGLEVGVGRDHVQAFAGPGCVAWTTGAGWQITRDRAHTREPIHVPDGETVLGLNEDGLVTRGGLILRHRRPASQRTLTACSGEAIDHAVHPVLPIIAIRRNEALLEVRSITDGRLLAHVKTTI
jgi:hypothetical protein